MHENTSARVLIVWELIEITEYCHLLEKGSKNAQMYHEILPTSTYAQTEITCYYTSLHPSDQFYMHENTSARLLIVCNRDTRVLSPAWKGLGKFADVPRNAPNFPTCEDGDHLFLG